MLHLQVTARLWHVLPRLALVLFLAAFLSLTLPILAANPGDLDPTFGNGEVVTSSFNSISAGYGPVGMAPQPDSKIVVIGGKIITPHHFGTVTLTSFLS